MDAVTTISGERYYYRFEEIGETLAVEKDFPDNIESCTVASLENYVKPNRTKQKIFDWLMGVLLPMVCFYFDQGVFRSWPNDEGLLSNFQVPAYALAYSAIMAQAAWLLWGERLGKLKILVGFVLLAATVAALLIGLVLFPFSIIGMFFLIGFLGFTPFFSAAVYWRSARKALGETS